jgi:hypothetical protein
VPDEDRKPRPGRRCLIVPDEDRKPRLGRRCLIVPDEDRKPVPGRRCLIVPDAERKPVPGRRCLIVPDEDRKPVPGRRCLIVPDAERKPEPVDDFVRVVVVECCTVVPDEVCVPVFDECSVDFCCEWLDEWDDSPCELAFAGAFETEDEELELDAAIGAAAILSTGPETRSTKESADDRAASPPP